jgi:hypothetical protein
MIRQLGLIGWLTVYCQHLRGLDRSISLLVRSVCRLGIKFFDLDAFHWCTTCRHRGCDLTVLVVETRH